VIPALEKELHISIANLSAGPAHSQNWLLELIYDLTFTNNIGSGENKQI
jgi:hypothetical protein